MKALRRCYSRRHGKSLIEALVIISMMSIIVGMAATSLGALFRLRYVMVRDAEQAASLDRLAMRLRLDAHEATSAAAEEGYVLGFADGRSIQYSYAAPRIVREVRRDEEVVHRDTFLLPRLTLVAFDDESISRGLLRILIKPEETKLPPREIPRRAVIEAAFGIHGRSDPGISGIGSGERRGRESIAVQRLPLAESLSQSTPDPLAAVNGGRP